MRIWGFVPDKHRDCLLLTLFIAFLHIAVLDIVWITDLGFILFDETPPFEVYGCTWGKKGRKVSEITQDGARLLISMLIYSESIHYTKPVYFWQKISSRWNLKQNQFTWLQTHSIALHPLSCQFTSFIKISYIQIMGIGIGKFS